MITHLAKHLSELNAVTIERCLRHSHERTLLLVEQKLDSWGFQHKIFQEYLSEAIVHDPEHLDILVDHLGEDHWRVVFDLFVEGQMEGRGRTWYWLEGL